MTSHGLFQAYEGSSNIRNSIHIIHHSHRTKKKIMIIAIDAKKAYKKTQHLSMFKNTQ